MRIVGVIPARGGSQRLPGKNLAIIGGLPLVAHTVQAACDSGVLSDVLINTDDADIAVAAADAGATYPALRPAHLATADATTRDANRWLLTQMAKCGREYDAIMVLQPTSPLRTADDIRAAADLFEENAPCAVESVTRVAPASWLARLGRDGRIETLVGEECVYRRNGAIYLYRVEDYLTDAPPRKTLAYRMPPERSVDIDVHEDLAVAEFLMSGRCVC